MALIPSEILAEAHTACGYRSYYGDWLQNIGSIIVLHGHYRTVSAVLKSFSVRLAQPSWRFHDSVNPDLLTGLVIPGQGTAVVAASWLDDSGGRSSMQDIRHIRLEDTAERYPFPSPDVYRHLRIAKEYLLDIHDFWQHSTKLPGAVHDVQDILLNAFAAPQEGPLGPRQSRHGFGTSLSVRGPYSSVGMRPARRRTLIISPPGSGVAELMRTLGHHAAERGDGVIFLHCGLDPEQVDHLYLPDRQWLISHSVAPHWQQPTMDDQVFDLTAVSEDRDTGDSLDTLYYLYAQAYHMAWAQISRETPPAGVPNQGLVHHGLNQLASALPQMGTPAEIARAPNTGTAQERLF